MAASKESARAGEPAGISEDMVRDYLADNADFLQRNPDLMDHLHINHASGSAVSLVEKQVSVLRERNVDMRRRLSALSANAKDNDALYEKTRALVLRLIEADSVDALHSRCEEALRTDFGVDYAALIFYGDLPEGVHKARYEPSQEVTSRLGGLLRSDRASCGTLREGELRFLFPAAGATGSAAVMPLRGPEPLGLVAVGSPDASHYTSDMGTLFLSHIADVMARLLPRLVTGGA